MPQSRRSAARRHTISLREAEATRGGVILGERKDPRRLVRNVGTQRVLPCCLEDCQRDGDERYQTQVKHDDPRWTDEVTGKQEMLVRIFCSPAHRDLWAAYYKRDLNAR